MYLQAETLDLGTVFRDTFVDNAVKAVMGMEAAEEPLGIMLVDRQSADRLPATSGYLSTGIRARDPFADLDIGKPYQLICYLYVRS